MEENLNHEFDPDLLAFNEIITQMPKVISTRVRLTSIFSSIHKKMNSGLAYDDILDSVFTSLSVVIPCNRLGIALLEDEGRSIRFKWVRSVMGVNALKKDYVASMKDSSLQQVIYTDRPRIINDMKEYLAEHPYSESTKLAIQDQINSNLCCPIRINDIPCGVIFFSSRKSFAFQNSHIQIFQEISEGLTLIIEHELMNKMILMTNFKEKIFRTTIHDLNNPLTVIKGTLDMIERKKWFDHLGNDSKKYFNTLRRNSDSMISLVNELVQMNGLES